MYSENWLEFLLHKWNMISLLLRIAGVSSRVCVCVFMFGCDMSLCDCELCFSDGKSLQMLLRIRRQEI